MYIKKTYLLTFLQTETSQKGFNRTLNGSFVLSISPRDILACLVPIISFSIQTSRVLKSVLPTS
jgi:hypothetical protein